MSNQIVITNVVAADTEKSFVIPEGTMSLTIKMRNTAALIKIAWASGETATKFMSFQGSWTMEALEFKNKTIFFLSDQAADIAEIQVITRK